MDVEASHQGGVIDSNEEEVKSNMSRAISFVSGEPPLWISTAISLTVSLLGSFPDPAKAAEDLHAFAKANDARLYKTLKQCLDIQSDLKTLIKSEVSPRFTKATTTKVW